MPSVHAVTGAFGYSGRYIAQRLLDQGCAVRTLTGSPARHNPFGDRMEVRRFAWDDPQKLAEALAGVEVLYNTYWVRFNHRSFTFAQAVANTKALFAAARIAGVRRIVHVSITNPDERSELEYFRGKAQLETALRGSGLSYAILRPAVIFGREDILINNIAWLLRRVPVFAVFGDGRYKLQPIYVKDLAQLAVDAGRGTANETIEAIGPETFTYRELVRAIGQAIGHPRLIVGVPPGLGYAIGKLAGLVTGDVVITRDEIRGLMQDRLYVPDARPAGTTKLTDWARANRYWLGCRYASELARRRDRVTAYTE